MPLRISHDITDEGWPRHVVAFEGDYEFERVEIVESLDHEGRILARAFEDEDGPPTIAEAFESRALDFDPISPDVGGSSLVGVSDPEDGEQPPSVHQLIGVALQTNGWTVVPSGDWWLGL